NVFVDDEIANHQHPHARHFGEGGLQAGYVEAVSLGKIQRLSYCREIRAGIVPLQQRQRGKAQLAGTENKSTPIRVHRCLFWIEALLELFSLDHHIRLQCSDEAISRCIKAHRAIDHADRSHVLKPHVLRKRDACHLVGIDPNDENISLLGCKLQESEVAGMNDVKVARDKSYTFGFAAGHSYFVRICRFSSEVVVIQWSPPTNEQAPGQGATAR